MRGHVIRPTFQFILFFFYLFFPLHVNFSPSYPPSFHVVSPSIFPDLFLCVLGASGGSSDASLFRHPDAKRQGPGAGFPQGRLESMLIVIAAVQMPGCHANIPQLIRFIVSHVLGRSRATWEWTTTEPSRPPRASSKGRQSSFVGCRFCFVVWRGRVNP